ncbi:CHAT domain-containing protein [Streptomyces sp. HNM0663]|uniref:CHAT domain-containing protein n=1 Tax=Streptomyces chengmaiensis TaxID=3040919 RepID=A0ABT6HY59_9ACTN|nr:CHAT domain-containing protein [Streptomyces chengmaiensis]MDH2393643.1 CHAT domain-containing protein [Streptomyces chengmaiensis]
MTQTTRPRSETAQVDAQATAVGPVVFAAFMLIITGVMDLLQGIMGIAKDDIFAKTPNYTFQYDVTIWGWFHLILGAIAILVALSLLRASPWARSTGIAIAGMLIITNFLSLPYYPIWSVICIALYVFVIWAMTAAGAGSTGRTRSRMDELAKLSEIRARGDLTEEEFQRAKLKASAEISVSAAEGSIARYNIQQGRDIQVGAVGDRAATLKPRADKTNHSNAGEPEARRLVARLAEQTDVGRKIPLHVQVVCGSESDLGSSLRPFLIPPEGARVTVTVDAPGLLALDDMQQELTILLGEDSDVLRFGFQAAIPGLHQVTVRAYRGGTFLGEVQCQISVEPGGVTRDGPKRSAPLPSVAFDPGEVTLQVVRGTEAGTFSFQLLSETTHAPEPFRFRAGDPRAEANQIYAELKGTARGDGNRDAAQLRRRLRAYGIGLWSSVVPEAVKRQFWEVADRISSFTVVGEHDAVPWELLYPLDREHDDHGFLAEWVPVVRRVFGQAPVRDLDLPGVTFVVPPDSPIDSDEEVRRVRAQFGSGVRDGGVLTKCAELTQLIKEGHAGALHFACHNTFTASSGSRVRMDDGDFDPVDLNDAAKLRSLSSHHPLVFFNACRSAGEIDWFGESLGWAPQFLKAGAGAFIGTLWAVRSKSALKFADAFYNSLLAETLSLGEASLAARRAISGQQGDPSWLAYAVYGSPAATAHITRT